MPSITPVPTTAERRATGREMRRDVLLEDHADRQTLDNGFRTGIGFSTVETTEGVRPTSREEGVPMNTTYVFTTAVASGPARGVRVLIDGPASTRDRRRKD